jgi:hypothetical protein
VAAAALTVQRRWPLLWLKLAPKLAVLLVHLSVVELELAVFMADQIKQRKKL